MLVLSDMLLEIYSIFSRLAINVRFSRRLYRFLRYMIFLDPQNKVLWNNHRPFVRFPGLSLCLELFSGTVFRIFLFFCMKLGCNEFKKWRSRIFQKKNFWSSGARRAQYVFEMGFIRFFEKLTHGICLIFLHEVTETQSLNNNLNYFFRENLVLSLSDQKRPKWVQKEVLQVLSNTDTQASSDILDKTTA